MLDNKWWRLTAHVCRLGRCLFHGQASRAGFFLAGIRRELQTPSSRQPQWKP